MITVALKIPSADLRGCPVLDVHLSLLLPSQAKPCALADALTDSLLVCAQQIYKCKWLQAIPHSVGPLAICLVSCMFPALLPYCLQALACEHHSLSVQRALFADWAKWFVWQQRKRLSHVLARRARLQTCLERWRQCVWETVALMETFMVSAAGCARKHLYCPRHATMHCTLVCQYTDVIGWSFLCLYPQPRAQVPTS